MKRITFGLACFDFKSPLAAPSPECDRLLAFIALQHCGDGEEGTEQHCAVIAGQFNQSRLLDEAAKFDQMAGAFASAHDPFPFIGAAQDAFNAVRHRLGALERPQRQPEFRDQSCVTARERMLRQLLAKPPSFPHPWF